MAENEQRIMCEMTYGMGIIDHEGVESLSGQVGFVNQCRDSGVESLSGLLDFVNCLGDP